MTLPSSGPLSISQIKTELGSSSNSLKALCTQAGFGPPYSISRFYGYTHSLGTIPTPSISASWDFTNHRMVVTISPASGTPTGVTWVVEGVPDTSATGGTTTTTTYIDAVNPEDGSQSCYICHGTKSGWTNSADSTEACDFRGNAQ